MSNFAAQCLVALALASHGAHAAITCATGWTPKTGVDNVYCPTDVESCSMSPLCCTVGDMCATRGNLVCDDGMYVKSDYTLVSDADAKAKCCVNKATCADATCTEGYEKDADNSAVKCPGAANTCAATAGCCKVKAGTCREWSMSAQCSTGMTLMDYAKTGADEASCCTTNVMCDTHTCPATHKLTGAAENTPCFGSACHNEVCCMYKETLCGAQGVVCGNSEYMDPTKAGVTFNANSANCCTAKAQCKDGVSPEASVSVSATPTIFLIAAVLYTAAN